MISTTLPLPLSPNAAGSTPKRISKRVRSLEIVCNKGHVPVSRTATLTLRPSHSGNLFSHDAAWISSLGRRPPRGNELAGANASLGVIAASEVEEVVVGNVSLERPRSVFAWSVALEVIVDTWRRYWTIDVDDTVTRKLAFEAEASVQATLCMHSAVQPRVYADLSRHRVCYYSSSDEKLRQISEHGQTPDMLEVPVLSTLK